jgi:hypothetical protein
MTQLPWSSANDHAYPTIDDAIRLSHELFHRLKQIGDYKYPLAVRKGVRSMTDEKNNCTVRAGSITYFLDIKQIRDGDPFLVITESRFKGEEEQRERRTLVVLKEKAGEFAQAVAEMNAAVLPSWSNI